jgi:ammonia channel protein AmtB
LSLNRLVAIRYGFNCGSTLALAGGADGINSGGGKLAGKVAMTTTISAASGAITTTLICAVVEQQYDLTMALNGVLAGLVGITANCAVVDPWSASRKPCPNISDWLICTPNQVRTLLVAYFI